MLHEICLLITNNGLGSFLILLALIWASERVITAFINRNKPVCDCECCQDNHEDEEDDEVVAMGGQVDEEDDDED